MSETGNLAKSVSRVLAVTLVVTTLAVSPWMTIDPINLIKLMTLSSGAFAIGILILVYFPRDLFVSDRTVLSISIIFILQLILVFFLSSFDKSLQFFGIMGRNTGLLFHLALVLVLLGSVIISRPEEYQKYITLITLVGLISAIYGLIQFLDLDPINWANKYSPIIGFLGNPNFQSSILGLSAIGALVILVDSSLTVIKRVFGLLCIFFSLLIAFLSDSQQGILVFALGFVCIGFFKVRSLRKRVLVNFYVVGATSIFLLSIIGFFNKGPLSNILYQPSVTYRGDYWRAGWNMALDNPIFGVGLNGYGDYYRKYRTLEATVRRGPEVISDAAHNVLIDLATSGGFILLAIYCCFILLALKRVMEFIRSGSRDSYFEGIIAIWIGFLAQSIISINQIGLAAWGWAFTGLVIGWRNESVNIGKTIFQRKGKSALPSRYIMEAKTLLTVFFGLALGAALSVPPLISSASDKSAVASAQLAKILEAEKRWPRDPMRSNQIVRILVANSLNREALKIARATTIQFAQNYDAWRIITEIPEASKAEKKRALQRMKDLDPLNPTLK